MDSLQGIAAAMLGDEKHSEPDGDEGMDVALVQAAEELMDAIRPGMGDNPKPTVVAACLKRFIQLCSYGDGD